MQGGGQAGDARRYPPHPFPSCQVLVPTRIGQVYVYDSPKGEQDEYDFPRHLLSAGSQEIYDVPPVRGGVPSQFSQEVRLVGVGGEGGTGSIPWHRRCSGTAWDPNLGRSHPKLGTLWASGLLLAPPSFPAGPWEEVGAHAITDRPSYVSPSPLQVYDTPPMAVKGPNGQDPGQEIYDVPPSVEKNLHQTVSAAGKLLASPYKTDTFYSENNCSLEQPPHGCGGVPGTGGFQDARGQCAG